MDKFIEIIPKTENERSEYIIYCKYYVSFNKKEKIFNNENDVGNKIKKIIINKKEEKNEKIKTGKYKFSNEGNF